MIDKTLKEREREHLENVLAKTHWDLAKSARLLRIPLSQVKRKITEYGVKKPGTAEAGPQEEHHNVKEDLE
ncbi:MAG: helix-turn-helix domain-containing protein [Pseudomonadota bacterium]